MTHCQLCQDTFCEGDSVIILRETVARRSKKSGRIIALEDPDTPPIARHLECHEEQCRYESRDTLYDEIRRQVEEEEMDRLRLEAREEILNEQQFHNHL